VVYRTVGKRLSLWRVAYLPSLELWYRERLSRRVSSVVAAQTKEFDAVKHEVERGIQRRLAKGVIYYVLEEESSD
jgi:hypothetical protein